MIPTPSSHHPAGAVYMPPAVSARDLARTRRSTAWRLGGDWARVLGQLPLKWSMLVSGAPGAGKSTALVLLADRLALSAGDRPVLYIAVEEAHSQSTVDRLARCECVAANLLVSAAASWVEINSEVQKHQPAAVLVDSFTAANMEQGQLVRLAEHLAGPVIVSVHQTKEGQPAGDAGLSHLVDIVAEVTAGVLQTTKCRYAALGSLRLWGDVEHVQPS